LKLIILIFDGVPNACCSVDFQTLIQLPCQIFTIIDLYHMMSLVFDSKIEM